MAKKTSTKSTDKAVSEPGSFMFSKINYMIMLAGIVVITLGFILMSGSEDIYNSTKLTVAPIVVIIGFVIELFAIMYRPKQAE